MLSIAPVSYTHLDVYKRQQLIIKEKQGFQKTNLGISTIFGLEKSTTDTIKQIVQTCYK